MLQNVDTALSFLMRKNVKLVNVHPNDIVDGNPKLTLGLIWTIILHFQVSSFIRVLGQITVANLLKSQRCENCHRVIIGNEVTFETAFLLRFQIWTFRDFNQILAIARITFLESLS